MRTLLVLAILVALAVPAAARAPKRVTQPFDARDHAALEAGDTGVYRGTIRDKRLGKGTVRYTEDIPGQLSITWTFKAGKLRAKVYEEGGGPGAGDSDVSADGGFTGGTKKLTGAKGHLTGTGRFHAANTSTDYHWKGRLSLPAPKRRR